jgi:hypothetical protein
VYKNMEQGVVALVFRCSVSEAATAGTDGEATEVAWLTVDEIERRMDEAYAVRLLDALLSTPPAVRAHNGVTLQEET